MNNYKFKKGDDYPPEDGEAAVSGIHVFHETDGSHYNRIEIKVYGFDWTDEESMVEAQKMRDHILKKLVAD